MNKIINELKLFWKNYVLQSLFATLSIFMLLLVINIQNVAIIASIGATTFIIFAMPNYFVAKPRNVIGGHLIGVISGSLFSLVPYDSFLLSTFIYALAVGISIFVMVVVDAEHPPASGTALGMAIRGFSVKLVIVVLVCVILLSLIHRLLKLHLRDLA